MLLNILSTHSHSLADSHDPVIPFSQWAPEIALPEVTLNTNPTDESP